MNKMFALVCLLLMYVQTLQQNTPGNSLVLTIINKVQTALENPLIYHFKGETLTSFDWIMPGETAYFVSVQEEPPVTTPPTAGEGTAGIVAIKFVEYVNPLTPNYLLLFWSIPANKFIVQIVNTPPSTSDTAFLTLFNTLNAFTEETEPASLPELTYIASVGENWSEFYVPSLDLKINLFANDLNNAQFTIELHRRLGVFQDAPDWYISPADTTANGKTIEFSANTLFLATRDFQKKEQTWQIVNAYLDYYYIANRNSEGKYLKAVITINGGTISGTIINADFNKKDPYMIWQLTKDYNGYRIKARDFALYWELPNYEGNAVPVLKPWDELSFISSDLSQIWNIRRTETFVRSCKLERFRSVGKEADFASGTLSLFDTNNADWQRWDLGSFYDGTTKYFVLKSHFKGRYLKAVKSGTAAPGFGFDVDADLSDKGFWWALEDSSEATGNADVKRIKSVLFGLYIDSTQVGNGQPITLAANNNGATQAWKFITF
jgi:hypothetical protein